MAKKKTKREKKKGFAYSSELYGVIFLLTVLLVLVSMDQLVI